MSHDSATAIAEYLTQAIERLQDARSAVLKLGAGPRNAPQAEYVPQDMRSARTWATLAEAVFNREVF